MIDLIVFSVGSNKYALNIENIRRIIQATELTNIPNAHKLIDGMLSYESKVIKVLNFRKLINIESYDEELGTLFVNLKKAHQEWIDGLRHAVENSLPFTKTTNPHMCELGVWLDNFNSYDDKVSVILKRLIHNHKSLHVRGGDALALSEADPKKALKLVNGEIQDAYNSTMGDLETFMEELDKVANSLQKLIIYESNNKIFAIKVDKIEDIAHIQESQIIYSKEEESNEFLQLDGVLDLDNILINVIKNINIPS